MKLTSKNLLLIFAVLLIILGLLKPNLSNFIINKPSNITVIDVEKPTNESILDECQVVTDSLINGSSDRKIDAKRLASLYSDMATLISLDGDSTVIKDTEEIRQANKLVGLMLKLDIKGKYPGLAEAAQKLVVECIGDDHVLLDAKLRQGAVDGFKALAWSCDQGAK